jgi:dihydroorotate dehydrogenase
MKVLQLLPPERAHRAAIGLLQAGLYPRGQSDPASLRTSLCGLEFPNPLGMAAGFDKNAEVPDALLKLGFGFTEVGTITPQPQPGNPRPRVFRDPAHAALINRLGFNGEGLDAAAARLARRVRQGIVGANVGKNKTSPDAIADYVACIARLAPLADYLVINISSPNTPGLRDWQEKSALAGLLAACVAARDAAAARPPLWLKVAPDLDNDSLAAIIETALDARIDALVLGNTTLSRPDSLSPEFAREAGGLSGRPLFALSTERLRFAYGMAAGRLPLIGVGGVASGADAYEKILNGATLVQLYTALVYQGPGLVVRIKRDLGACLQRDGFASVAEAVGQGVG